MAIPVVAAAALALGTFGGIVWWGRERAKLRTGDTAFVAPEGIQLPGNVKVESLAGLGGMVKVENVTRSPAHSPSAQGTAGKELGLSFPVTFAVKSTDAIERKGQQFQNPEKA